MEAALRPHRGGAVFALGMLSLIAALFLLPLGIVAWIMGSNDLKAMNQGRVDSAGRALTQIGWVLGIAASVLWLGMAGRTVLVMSANVRRESFSSLGDGVQTRTNYYAREASDHGESLAESKYQEVLQPKGAWVKEGPATRWNRSGKKLEEGSYHDGKRDGQWHFWNEDGSIDKERSGMYQSDVRIGPSPPGDFSDDEVR